MNADTLSHFKKNDPILYEWILKIDPLPPFTPHTPDQYFIRLCDSIISQQLSGKAAATIFSRFQKLFRNGIINPAELLQLHHEKLREAGLSNAKATYVKNLAQYVIENQLTLENFASLSDEEIIITLTQVKGIGLWTAEMFLMFSLNRPDVFSHGDRGLRNAIKKIYNLKREPSKKKIESIVKKWKPHRSFASRILWKSLEIKSTT